MIELPFQLSARSRLLGADVAQVFAALRATLNGGLGAEHFTPRAAIPNSMKALARGYACSQARIKEITAVPAGSLDMGALCPPASFPTAPPFTPTYYWELVGASLAYTAGGPMTLDVRIGSTPLLHSLGSVGPGVILDTAEPQWIDYYSGKAKALLSISVVANPVYDVVLTAFWKAKHVR